MTLSVKSELATKRDEWLSSDEAKVSVSTDILHFQSYQVLLINRLEAAFMAGAKAQEEIGCPIIANDLNLAKNEAESLAIHLWEKHYSDESPKFGLCDSVAGVISQIDNMTSGMERSKND